MKNKILSTTEIYTYPFFDLFVMTEKSIIMNRMSYKFTLGTIVYGDSVRFCARVKYSDLGGTITVRHFLFKYNQISLIHDAMRSIFFKGITPPGNLNYFENVLGDDYIEFVPLDMRLLKFIFSMGIQYDGEVPKANMIRIRALQEISYCSSTSKAISKALNNSCKLLAK